LKLKNPKLTKGPIRDLRFEIKVANKHENKKNIYKLYCLKMRPQAKKSHALK
jgi:hypothetical protein